MFNVQCAMSDYNVQCAYEMCDERCAMCDMYCAVCVIMSDVQCAPLGCGGGGAAPLQCSASVKTSPPCYGCYKNTLWKKGQQLENSAVVADVTKIP